MGLQKKVLIIGEHSYIGNSFKEYEEKSCACRLKVETAGAVNEAWKQVDFSEYQAVLHVAAIVHQKESAEKEQLYIEVNEKLPVKIAQRAKESGVRQFIFLSTMAVYGEVEGAITKETPLKPVTMYGKTKLAAERKLQELNSEQFKVTILRPPMVYGENCPGNYSRLKKLAKYLPVFPDIENKRSMIHIDNLCQCIALLIERECAGVICPRDELPVKTTDLYVQLREDMGKKTWTTRLFNGLIVAAKGKVGSVRKLFGSCYYEEEKRKF